MPSKKCRLVDLPHREFSVHREGTGALAIGGIEKLIEHLHKAAAGRVCDLTTARPAWRRRFPKLPSTNQSKLKPPIATGVICLMNEAPLRPSLLPEVLRRL